MQRATGWSTRFALGCQIGDCCWEGISAAGLALLEEAEGDGGALERFRGRRAPERP
jgi:hypothetical protein